MICLTCRWPIRDGILLRPVPCQCNTNFTNEVIRTSPEMTVDERLTMGALGLAGETGEVVDIIKKYQFQGKPIDRQEFIKELGDVRWYLECLMVAVKTDIGEIERVNVAKLRTRYPNGFTKEDSATRRDEL